MKKIKRIMALVIALAMVLGLMSMAAFADPTGALEPDTTMKVSGLEAGDQVKFIKLIKWTPNVGWEWVDGFDAAVTAAQSTLSDADKAKVADATAKAALLKTITGWTTPAPATAGVISAENGGLLAQIAQKMTQPTAVTVGEGKDFAEYNLKDDPTDQEQIDYLGLYVALVDPAKAEYVYNPIFVAADYNPDDTNTNEIAVEEGKLSYTPVALAKKEKVTLTKTSGTETDVQYDVKIGDTIDFEINSVIPEFSTSYVNPQYEISDTMSTGLELVNDSIVVKVISSSASADTKAEDENWQLLVGSGANSQYTLTPSTNGFVIALKSDYLKTNDNETKEAKDIKVTYKGKVTSIDDLNIVQKENTATVKFSNNPGDSSSYSLLEDKTNHYVFNIDANMLGKDDWENSELVKIGLSPDGTEIHQSKLSNGTMAGILEGAKFGLYTSLQGVEGGESDVLYTNQLNSTGYYFSDSNGKLNISGLDAGVATGINSSTGTYYLKEIDAPAGYIKSSDVWKIVIEANYNTVQAGSYYKNSGTSTPQDANDILVNYDAYDYLTGYKVTVTNITTSTTVDSNFTITNSGTQKKIAVSASGDATTKLNNTRGTELPSTGGIGTTIFYVVGALLVIGAGVILITRRRMDA